MMSVSDVQRPEAAVYQNLLSDMLIDRRKGHLWNNVHEIDQTITGDNRRVKTRGKIGRTGSWPGKRIKLWHWTQFYVFENVVGTQHSQCSA